MPLPTFVFLVIGTGMAAALAGGSELRLSPRHVLLTGTFTAYALFLGLLLVPASAYFYIFHGDWFLLYTLDVQQVPSAIALVAFLIEGSLGVVGFSIGSSLARSQHTTGGAIGVGLCALGAAAPVFVWPERLGVVGSYAQYRGGFGLVEYGGPLLHGALAAAGYVALGAAFLLIRIRWGQRNA